MEDSEEVSGEITKKGDSTSEALTLDDILSSELLFPKLKTLWVTRPLSFPKLSNRTPVVNIVVKDEDSSLHVRVAD